MVETTAAAPVTTEMKHTKSNAGVTNCAKRKCSMKAYMTRSSCRAAINDHKCAPWWSSRCKVVPQMIDIQMPVKIAGNTMLNVRYVRTVYP